MSITTLSHRWRLTVLAVVAASLVALLLGPAARDRPVGAVARSVTVSQAQGLVSGQTITVDWAGFTPDAPVYLHQCVRNTTMWRDCAELTRVTAMSDATGAGSTAFTIWGGDIDRPAGIVGANGPISCALGQCMLVVSECGFDLFAERTVTRPIALKAADNGTNPSVTSSTTESSTTTSLPPPGELREPGLSGIADSDSQLLTEAWQFDVLGEPERLDVNLTTVNAPSANEGFTGNEVTGYDALYDFAFTNLPLTEDQVAKMDEVDRGFAYVPVALNGLVLGYNFKINGIRVDDLALDPATLALTYTGQIASWNSPTITGNMGGCKFSNTNAGSAYPVPGFRTDRSGANWWFNSWLAVQAPTEWQPVLDISGGIDVNLGINDSKVIGETGADKLSEFVELGRPGQSGGDNDRLNAPVAGRFAFYDRSLAEHLGTKTMRVRNAAGEMVAPTDDAILAGFEAANRGEDGVWRPDFTTPTPGAYPLPVVTYALVPTALSETFTPEKGQVLRDLLTYLVSDQGQGVATDLGYVELPDELHDAALAEIAKIPVSAPVTTTTTTTAPSTTTTAAPTTTTTWGPTPTYPSSTDYPSSYGGAAGYPASSASSSSSGGGFAAPVGSSGGGESAAATDDGADAAEGVVAEDSGSGDADMVAFVVGRSGPVPTVTMALLVGLGALAAGPTLGAPRRKSTPR